MIIDVGMIETSEKAPGQTLALRVHNRPVTMLLSHGWTSPCLRKEFHMPEESFQRLNLANFSDKVIIHRFDFHPVSSSARYYIYGSSPSDHRPSHELSNSFLRILGLNR